MSATARAAAIVLILGVSTCGEGGAIAPAMLATHLVLALSIVGCVLFSPPATHAPARAPSLAWVAFLVLAALSAVTAPYAYAAWLVLVELLAFTTLVTLTSGEPLAVARIVAPALAFLAAAQGIVAVIQKATGSARPASTFLNPNHLAAWLAAVSLFLIGSAFGREGRARARVLCGLAVIPSAAGIFVTGSRGALVGLLAGTTALFALRQGTMTARVRRLFQAAVIVCVLTAILGVAVRFRTDDDPYRFQRTRIWAAALQGASRAFWLGVGPGQFAAAAPNMNFALAGAPLNYERAFRSPHSDLLRAVCEFGFAAGCLGVAALALAVWEAFRRRADLTGAERGAMAALAALAAQGLVDDLTSRPALTMAGALFVGLIVAKRRDVSVVPAVRGAATVAALLVVLALGPGELAGFAAWSRLQGLPHGRLDAGQLDRLHRSLFWNPMHPAAWLRLSEHFVGDGQSWDVAAYARAREAAENARRLQPADAFYARAQARVEATACLSIFPFETTRDRAARLYDEASRLARTDATIPLEASKFLIQAGDAAGARREAKAALAIEPRAATPRLALARAIVAGEGGRGVAQARRLLDEAQALAPRAGEPTTSSYDATLRLLDPNDVAALLRELDRAGAP